MEEKIIRKRGGRATPLKICPVNDGNKIKAVNAENREG